MKYGAEPRSPLRRHAGSAAIIWLAMATTLAVVSWSIVVSAAVGPRINGSGTKSASLLFDVLTKAYRFPRDDVIVRYDPVGSSIATLQSYIVDFNVFERPIGLDLRLMYNISHLPLAGQAIVMAYHLPEFDPLVDPPLALDRATLAAIWSGDIATWNHAAIAALNPDLASRLPPVNITLGYIDDFYLSAAEVVKLSLESFDSGFASEFASRNRTFGLLRFARDGRGRALSDSSPDRVAWVDATPYGLTFVDYVDIPAADASGSASSVRAASIYNRAGYLVEPSVASVQLAMRDFSDRYAAGDLAVEIYDAPGDGSWPLAYVPLVALSNRFVQKDCTRIKELVNFFAWVHTNDAATEAMTALRFAPLDQSLKKRVVDSIDTILCNYAPSFETDYLIGYGAPLSILTTWVKQWSSAATIAAYYTTSSADAVDLQSDFGSDFGVTLVGARSTDLIGRDTRSALPADLSVVPLAGFALVPAYHVPYPTTLPLVLDAAAIAGIYLGTIRSWDHPRIAALNPGVALPPMDIVVIVHDTHSDFNWLLTSWLSDHVPAFAASVGRAYAPRYPVQNITGAFVAITTPFGVDDALLEREGSFAMWPQFGAGLIWRVDTVLPASLAQEGGIIIAPDVGSVEHALGAYVSTDGLESLAQLDGVVPVAQADADKAWPVTAVVSLAYRSTSMTDCAKATALADLLQWTQSDSAALLAAERQGFAVATSADPRLAANVLDALAGIECDGKQVSVLARCISRGTLCSNHGTCVPDASGGKCICDKDHTGDSCDMTKGSSGSDSTLAIALAVGITSVGIVLAIAVCLVVLFALVAVHRSRRANRDNDWEIRYDELDLGESLGSGGYGEVRRAMWKGTDVAVKVMSADVITREMERNFCEEVRVMTSLRHPNVVLFMAACTKPPNMCIVMEYMALGSLYELLHNELIPDLPFALKAKMAYQASKGLYFLHSSGIVHRDVKSLNLLLDNKWNVKVSDFGLTKFRADLADEPGATAPIGSVHWMAPEVLNETLDVDYALADVYSFGIILWEVLTRCQPYKGLSPAAVAVAVIRDGARPAMPLDATATHPQAYIDLIQDCWHSDPTVRPAFMEIMTRLSTMHGELSGGMGISSSGSSGNNDDSLSHQQQRLHLARRGAAMGNTGDSWTLPSASSVDGARDYDTGSTASSIDRSDRGGDAVVAVVTRGPEPPQGTVAIVFADVARAAALWEHDPEAMRDATIAYNETARGLLDAHRGYESLLSSTGAHATDATEGAQMGGEGSFCIVFARVDDAIAWCAAMQRALLNISWPRRLMNHPAAAEEWGGPDDALIFSGLRARMGIHVGSPRTTRDRISKRVAYSGACVDAASYITALAHGGQVVMSAEAHKAMRDEKASASAGVPLMVRRVGRARLPDSNTLTTAIYEVVVSGIEARFFGAGASHAALTSSESSDSARDSAALSRSPRDGDGASVQDLEHMATDNEQRYLASANLCRWVIDFDTIQMGKQVGVGSYGVVYSAKWKGRNVAVKRFIRQQLDERAMLDLRAETALLVELSHPNVVVFVGACVRRPNLCILTEFVERGDLRTVLSDTSLRIPWATRMRLARTAAAGVAYLHGRPRPIIHRDLKSSNLLVDANFEVKVADFGFARIRQDNATMTRCGTPAWTAPEILRGEHYSEKADVYSFGIVLWEIVTRRQPYQGRNFMAVTLDVLDGNRPEIPADCPAPLATLIARCWRKKAHKRPSMQEVFTQLDTMCGGASDGMSAFV